MESLDIGLNQGTRMLVLNFNPYHDELGRFASGPSAFGSYYTQAENYDQNQYAYEVEERLPAEDEFSFATTYKYTSAGMFEGRDKEAVIDLALTAEKFKEERQTRTAALSDKLIAFANKIKKETSDVNSDSRVKTAVEFIQKVHAQQDSIIYSTGMAIQIANHGFSSEKFKVEDAKAKWDQMPANVKNIGNKVRDMNKVLTTYIDKLPEAKQSVIKEVLGSKAISDIKKDTEVMLSLVNSSEYFIKKADDRKEAIIAVREETR